MDIKNKLNLDCNHGFCFNCLDDVSAQIEDN